MDAGLQPLFENFPDENACLAYLERIRWNGIVESPFVPISKVYRCAISKYKCRESGKYFNVKTNTLFHNSRITIRKWFMAIVILSESKKMTSVNLAQQLGITQKSAWYMIRRLKKHAPENFDPTVFLHQDYIDNIDVVVERDRLRLVEWLNLIK